MSTIVGQLAAELGLDTAKFEEGLKKVPGMTQQHMSGMSSEMKRASKEGAESLRLIDEAFGIHISRPITRIITQEFPGLAKGLQSLLGAGVVVGIAGAAFEFVSRGIERIGKAIDDAKKKEEEFIASTHALQIAINEQAISSANALDQVKQKLAELSGDKAGALAAQLRIITRDDAEQAVRAIDAISDAFMRQAKAAAEAASWVTKLEAALGYLTTSPLDKQTEKISRLSTEIKNNYDQIVTSDPLKGLEKGKSYLEEEVGQQQKLLEAMKKNELSGFDTFAAKAIPLLDTYVAKHGAVTKETLIQQQALVASLQEQVKITNQLLAIDQGKKHVAAVESASRPDVGEKELTRLRSDTEAQLDLAAATGKSTAEQRLQQASGEASTIITKILTEAHGRLTAAIREQLAAVHALTAERQVAKDAVQTNADLTKETQAYDRQIATIQGLVDAYAKGGSAISGALIEKQLEADKQKVADLTEEYQLLKKAADDYSNGKAALGKAAGPVQGLQGVDPAALDKLKTSLDNANASLETHRAQLEKIQTATYQEEINKTSDAMRTEQPLLDRLNQAYAQNAEAVRHAEVALELYRWQQAHPGASAEQIQQENDLLEQQSANTQRATDARAAGSYIISRLYDDELAKLERIREVIQANGESTLLIDAKIQAEQDALNKQWDDAAFKVGTFGDRTKAVFNELVIQGHEAGEQIGRAFLQAIDESETALAKLLTGQKVDARKIVQNQAEYVTKAQIQKGVGALAEHFPGLKGLLGSASKPDGTSGNPLNVKIVGGLQLPGSGNGSGLPSFGGLKLGGSGGGGSFDISSLIPEFGGFMAEGGDLTPGKRYIVGEKGPELLNIGKRGASITPNRALRDAGGTTYQGHNIKQEFHYHGTETTDLFKRTTKQHSARQMRDLTRDLGRS